MRFRQVCLLTLAALLSNGCAAEGAGSPSVDIVSYGLESDSGEDELNFEVDYLPLEGATEASARAHARSVEPAVRWVDGDELVDSAAMGYLDESYGEEGPAVASAEEGECVDGDEPACVGGSRSALVCGGACIGGAVVALGRLGFFVWRVTRTSRVVHAGATVTSRTGASRTVGIHVTGRAADALQTQVPSVVGRAASTAVMMESLSDRHLVEEPVGEEERTAEEETNPCPNDRLFVPDRTDTVQLCIPLSGDGILCTTRRHWPCAGSHTVGQWMYQWWDGTRCRTDIRAPAYRCDGPSPDPSTAVPCSHYVSATSCGSGGPESSGIWCGGAPCPFSAGYVGP